MSEDYIVCDKASLERMEADLKWLEEFTAKIKRYADWRWGDEEVHIGRAEAARAVVIAEKLKWAVQLWLRN